MLITIVVLIIILVWFVYEIYYSKLARSTRELHELNKIWEVFNEKIAPVQYIEQQLEAKEWKYHSDKVGLLKRFIALRKEAQSAKYDKYRK